MKTKIFLLLFTFLLINFVAAQGFCVDFDPPSAPSNLEVSGEVGNILLTWDTATDIPACSGIDYYTVKRNGNLLEIISTDTLSFIDTDNLEAKSYSYTVYATDKVGHNTGKSIKNDVVLSKPSDSGTNTRVSRGGGGNSYVCYEEWECSDWSECINEKQTKTCIDIAKCGTPNYKPETSRACTGESEKEVEILITTESTPSFFATITGAVTGFAKSGMGIVSLFFALLIMAGVGIVIFLRKDSLTK